MRLRTRPATPSTAPAAALSTLAALAGLVALMLLVPAAPAATPPPPPPAQPEMAEEGAPRPWDIDVAAIEAPGKIAFFRELTRWNELPSAHQLALDAIHYDLTLSLDPASQLINGHLVARMRVDGLNETVADLDLAPPLIVQAVTSGGQPAVWTHANERVSITLDRTYFHDEIVEIAVDYRGTPSADYGAFGFDTHNGDPMIWTLSEPFGARSWWPCDDWSDDKADSVDLHITVPSGLIVASNGELVSVTPGSGVDTYHWHEGYPISTYLVSLAIHPYTVYSDYYAYSPTDSMEIQFYIFPDDYIDTLDENLMTADMIGYFAGVYGEYPFLQEKYGHAEFLWGGAMEHQTCTSTGVFFESVIAHELAHQWWGDMVTCADFHHIWLNEGFATYSEALWLGDHYGPEGYWGQMNSARYYGGGTIYVPALDNWGRIFDGNLSYNKGSWVLHMLRHVIGDEDFFATLAAYRTAFEFSAATTEDFQGVAEAVSGVDLDDFFQQWIYSEYFPQYSYAWTSVPVAEGDALHLSIDQTQTTGLFHMPIDVLVHYAGGGSETLVIDNALAHEEYILALAEPATAVEIDPEGWILKQVQEAIVDPTFDQGILLVNGIDWATYGTEITDAYAAHAFWGGLPISFWDCFEEPAGGYPATLPAPLGHGRVPSTTLGAFETVIWVGNNFNGDLGNWLETAILPYLEAGGNVLLMTRQGDSFLGTDLRAYLGITFVAAQTISNCTAVHPELTNIARIGTQNFCPLFSQDLQQDESELLYLDTSYTPDRGVGVLRVPAAGGTYNPSGGRFAFLNGRPYRWDHEDLAANVETIVLSLFGQSAAVPGDTTGPARLALLPGSPAHATARLRFTLPEAGEVRLDLYDSQGRLVRALVDGHRPAGTQPVDWDGRDGRGLLQPAGVYFARLSAGGAAVQAPLLLIR